MNKTVIVHGKSVPNLPAADTRIATGAIRIGEDWPGVFIRGDEALAFARALRVASAFKNGIVDELVELLESCKV